MKFEIVWGAPLTLAKNKRVVVGAEEAFENVPEEPGIYFFSRKYGDKTTPFYKGRSNNLRKRLREHLRTVAIQDVLPGAKTYSNLVLNGNNLFHFGVISSKSEMKITKCLSVVERNLIEQAIAKEIVLLNVRLTTIHAHDVTFSGDKMGRSIFPAKFAVRERN